jgi:hypothetical protein
MKIFEYINNIFSKVKKIDVKNLPSQGFFYPTDLVLHIKRANTEDIEEYNKGYDRNNIHSVLNKLKSIVEKNVNFSNKYNFNHLKSIDVVYLFLEIVKFTKNKTININYFNEQKGEFEFVEFNSENFNYYNLGEIVEIWDPEKRCIDINGYKLTLPTIGIENSLTNYLIEKSTVENAIKYSEYNYNFTFFLNEKEKLTFSEIDNLIQIFNFDLDDDEKYKVNSAVELLKPMHRYSLIKENQIIEMSSKLDLETIWD